MSETFDLYAELGISLEASTEDVRKAYRTKAKEVHPDRGGTQEAFDRVKLAHDVLIDPERREKYDNTGEFEPGKPDNTRATALQIIDGFVGRAMNDFILSGFKPEKDPRYADLIGDIRGGIIIEMQEARHNIAMGQEVLDFFRDMAPRFKSKNGDDFLRIGVERQIESSEQRIKTLELAIKVREYALTMLADQRFETVRSDRLFLPRSSRDPYRPDRDPFLRHPSESK